MHFTHTQTHTTRKRQKWNHWLTSRTMEALSQDSFQSKANIHLLGASETRSWTVQVQAGFIHSNAREAVKRVFSSKLQPRKVNTGPVLTPQHNRWRPQQFAGGSWNPVGISPTRLNLGNRQQMRSTLNRFVCVIGCAPDTHMPAE